MNSPVYTGRQLKLLPEQVCLMSYRAAEIMKRFFLTCVLLLLETKKKNDTTIHWNVRSDYNADGTHYIHRKPLQEMSFG